MTACRRHIQAVRDLLTGRVGRCLQVSEQQVDIGGDPEVADAMLAMAMDLLHLAIGEVETARQDIKHGDAEGRATDRQVATRP
jgi:hypothetical protein